ncbi:MAG: pyridoxamine 5'-phosphate oxidase [Ignavibacteria bacterium]
MITTKDIQNLRRDYKLRTLSKTEVRTEPLEQFSIWFEEALNSQVPEPNAMILATVSEDCKPSVRTLLLKGFDERGFIFYTNYKSRKGIELGKNPNASILFFWPELERQIRIEGTVDKISREESEKYFATRPYKSKLGAWASNQSEIIPDRLTIVKKFLYYLVKFHSKEIPLPDFWGGYVLKPISYEFWQGRANRLHDRIRYRKENEKWIIERLSP